MRKILLFTAVIILLQACNTMKTVNIETFRPADLEMDDRIETYLILDRTELDKNAIGVIEAILTGELPGEEKAAVQQSISSLRKKLMESPRFHSVTATDRMFGNSLTAAFPEPLTWNIVDQLCKHYNTQSVISVEIFDIDFIVTKGKRQKEKTVGEGENKKTVKVDEYYAEGVGNLTMGIRLYDQINHEIIDEQLYKETNTWEESASSTAEAVAKLVDKVNATIYLAESIGQDYAFKVAPLPITLARSFYRKSKKSDAIVQGAKYAEVDDWNKAMETWERGMSSAETKDKGKLAYNMAIGYEVKGDYFNAVKYAQKAYADYGLKRARDYVKDLRFRIDEERRLELQMKKKKT